MKILIIGYGKMGKTIEKSAQSRAWQITHIVDKPADWDKINRPDLVDVAIEFTEQGHVIENVKKCFELRIPVVCGTTGWYSSLPQVIDLCQEMDGTLLYAPNFSKGVNILFALNRWLTRNLEILSGYRVSITEAHHQHKLDAPSGTAVKLANDIIISSKEYESWTKGDPSNSTEIPVRSIRNGETPGTHCLVWDSPEDSFRIIHEAKSRQMFAEGALDAANWLPGKKGIFTFEQMLFSSLDMNNRENGAK